MSDPTNEEIRQKLADELDARFSRSPSHQDHVLIRLKEDLVDPGYYFVPAGSIGLGKLTERSMLSSDLTAVDGYFVVFIHEDGDTTSTQAFVHEVDVLDCEPSHRVTRCA